MDQPATPTTTFKVIDAEGNESVQEVPHQFAPVLPYGRRAELVEHTPPEATVPEAVTYAPPEPPAEVQPEK